ncbi:MAG: phosphate ABC transporter substrate-binding protein [Nitrospiraceae bacterium]|nr:MAG: phosphate ABC transporter substrate-binding protein [Nitrospiraceae bacterium]
MEELMNKFRTGFLAGVFIIMAVVTVSFGDEIKIGGGGAALNSIFKPIKPHFEQATGITLNILQSTPRNGVIDLVQGRLDVATAAVPLESILTGIEKEAGQIDTSDLQQHIIGQNRTVIFVHKDNPVNALTKEQLQDIFTGKTENWKEVGGSDMPIIVVWGKASPGQNALFTKMILDGEQVTMNQLDATDYQNIKETIAVVPEAIGINPLGLSDDTVKVVQSPDVLSPIILITCGNPSPEAQQLVDFIKGDGKKFVTQ